MNKRDAKRKVLRETAAMVRCALACGDYLDEDDDGNPSPLSETDVKRIDQAAEELIDELDRRGGADENYY